MATCWWYSPIVVTTVTVKRKLWPKLQVEEFKSFWRGEIPLGIKIIQLRILKIFFIDQIFPPKQLFYINLFLWVVPPACARNLIKWPLIWCNRASCNALSSYQRKNALFFMLSLRFPNIYQPLFLTQFSPPYSLRASAIIRSFRNRRFNLLLACVILSKFSSFTHICTSWLCQTYLLKNICT